MLVIPTYNERENIRLLVERIQEVLPNFPILFIDDNSPDGTAEEIRRLQTRYPNIQLHVRTKKLGLGSAYREAFAKLLQNSELQYLISLDADLSHPPESLPQIIRLLLDHHMVVGSRYALGGKIVNWNWPRRLISRLGNFYARIFTRVPLKDLTSGFVGYRVDALRKLELSSLNAEGYAFQIEMKTRLFRDGARMAEVPIVFTERREGMSKFSFAIIMEAVVYPFKSWLNRHD